VIKSNGKESVGHVTIGKLRGSCTGSVGMLEVNRLKGSCLCRWEDNFKMGLLDIKLGVWIDLAGDGDRRWPLFNTKLRGSIQRGEFLDELKIYQFLNTMLHTVCKLVSYYCNIRQ